MFKFYVKVYKLLANRKYLPSLVTDIRLRTCNLHCKHTHTQRERERERERERDRQTLGLACVTDVDRTTRIG